MLDGEADVIFRSGERFELSASGYTSVMDALGEEGHEPLTISGAAVLCATCQVELNPEVVAGRPPKSEAEAYLLGTSEQRMTTLRLSRRRSFGSAPGGIRQDRPRNTEVIAGAAVPTNPTSYRRDHLHVITPSPVMQPL